MDNHWPSDVVEFGAINITGFRIVDTNRRALRDFHDSRKRLEPHTAGGGNGASLPAISVNVQKNYELLFTIAISIPSPFSLSLSSLLPLRRLQAQAALMYDAVFVLVEAFNRILRKKPDQFRANHLQRRSHGGGGGGGIGSGSSANALNESSALLDCNTSKGWVTPWEQGEKISRVLRKVRHKKQKKKKLRVAQQKC